jgi:hypothetical protein
LFLQEVRIAMMAKGTVRPLIFIVRLFRMQ